MRLFILAALLFFFMPTGAQPHRRHVKAPFDFDADSIKARYVSFTGDSSASCVSARYEQLLKAVYTPDSNYDFEFRLWKCHLQQNFDNVFVLTLKNNRWIARYFDLNTRYGDSIRFTERTVDQSGINQLWMLLTDNNVLTLPSQGSLNNRLLAYVVDTANLQYGQIWHTDITDGILYSFELVTPAKKRSYAYGCPQAFLKKYGNVQELYHAVVIIMLIEKFLGQPCMVC